ncbi:MAG TPA: rRNA adenine N-6-methyltransferase family protein, partial [Phytomonospora sp.]
VVVEPGPGEGAVTWRLARVAARVVAVERDARLADRLARRAPPNVTVRRADFRAVSPPAGEFHLVGNIPFSVTSDIVAWCLDAASLRSATMVTQLEYARKRTGGYHRWSLLTVSTWPEFDWSFHGRVERGAFRPVPGVDAAILRLTRRARPLLAPGRMGLWRETVEAGFTGRGGSLAASLALVHPARRVKAAFARAGLDTRVPVGHVGPGDWLAVFAHL